MGDYISQIRIGMANPRLKEGLNIESVRANEDLILNLGRGAPASAP